MSLDAGGVNCEVLRGGELRVGDVVEVEPGSYRDGRADDGGKKAAFYKRPSLRTPDEVESLARLPRGKPARSSRSQWSHSLLRGGVSQLDWTRLLAM